MHCVFAWHCTMHGIVLPWCHILISNKLWEREWDQRFLLFHLWFCPQNDSVRNNLQPIRNGSHQKLQIFKSLSCWKWLVIKIRTWWSYKLRNIIVFIQTPLIGGRNFIHFILTTNCLKSTVLKNYLSFYCIYSLFECPLNRYPGFG